MNEDIGTQLGRRERQIVEALYRLGKATVGEVLANLPEPPSYSAVRMLSLLEQKGYVWHKRDGMRYVYAPAIAPLKRGSRLSVNSSPRSSKARRSPRQPRF
jgi:predicted transcriptional regulator